MEYEKQESVQWKRLALPLLGILLFGVMNGVGGTTMSYVMPNYPSWLLYGTTLIYTLFFFLVAVFRGQRPWAAKHFTRGHQKHYLKLGALTAGNGLLFQFAAGYVDGETSSVLTNVTLVCIPFFQLWYFPSRSIPHRAKVGLVVVMCGILVGSATAVEKMLTGDVEKPSEQSDAWYWVVAFLLSTMIAAWEQVAQDAAFHDHSIPDGPLEEESTLAWYNMYSLLAYLITIPLEAVPIVNGTPDGTSISEAFANQGRAFGCYFGATEPGCQAGSFWWPTVFTLGYLGQFTLNAHFITQFGALYPNMVGTVTTLLCALVFTSSGVMGKHADSLTPWPFVGLLLVLGGMYYRGKPDRVGKEGMLLTRTKSAASTGV